MSNPLYDALIRPHVGQDASFLQCTNRRGLTYGDFVGMSSRFAGTLSSFGLSPGDRLATHVDKSPEGLAIYAACIQAGIVLLPLNPGSTPSEVSYFLQDSGARMLIGRPSEGDTLEPICARERTVWATLEADGTGTFTDAAADRPERFDTVARESNDLVALLYTSGTTGRSKGAMLTQGNLLSNARTLTDIWRFSPDDVLLHALPIFHTHGLFVGTNITLLAGSSMIFLPRFDVADILSRIDRATVLMGVPTFYTRLLAAPSLSRAIVEHMRLFISGSAPLPEDVHREFAARTGHRILERYGMTETNMNTSNPYDGERRAGTVGFPLPDIELRVTDTGTGTPVSPGEIGQFEVRGPNVFKGYWNMPEKTRAELRDDGFFRTGDLGFVDSDGYVHIVGRQKDVIISGGYNIYPKELEQVIDSQAGVLESAVIGVPHPDLGESVVAVIVPQPGRLPKVDEIAAALREALAGFKQPRRFELLDALPRNAMAKVQKSALRDRFSGVFGA